MVQQPKALKIQHNRPGHHLVYLLCFTYEFLSPRVRSPCGRSVLRLEVPHDMKTQEEHTIPKCTGPAGLDKCTDEASDVHGPFIPYPSVGVVRFVSEHVLLLFLLLLIHHHQHHHHHHHHHHHRLLHRLLQGLLQLRLHRLLQQRLHKKSLCFVSTVGDDGSRQCRSDAKMFIRLL